MASIKQNPSPFPSGLPDFRNLGVNLSVLLMVNAMAIVAAVLRADSWGTAWQKLLEISTLMQPVLLASLLVLYGFNRQLRRLPYTAGIAAVLLLTLGLTSLALLAATALFGPETQPSWSRAWFFSAIICATLLGYFHLRGKALSPAITEARLQALQARIRPHFLFNSINAVLSLIRHDPIRAETALQDMADLFRVLMADNRQLVPLESELDLCRQYLALEKLRLGERLQLAWHLEDMPAKALVPPLVLQPLLENAVYHGIEPFQEGGVIEIRISRQRNVLHLTLTNPYRKHVTQHSGNKMALANIRERLVLHFDAEGQLKTQVIGNTYQVDIMLPYRTEADL